MLARLADVHAPEASKLLQKASGAVLHGGGAPWPAASTPYERVFAWIRAGARLDHAAHEEAAAAPEAREPERHHEGERHETRTPEAAPLPTSAAVSHRHAGRSSCRPCPRLGAGRGAAGPTFATAVHPVLMSVCAACHRAGGPAGMTRFLLSGDAARDEAIVRALVDPHAPESSLLLTKAAGQMHAGGAPLPAGDPRRAAIVAWIAGLAAPPPAAAPVPGARAPARRAGTGAERPGGRGATCLAPGAAQGRRPASRCRSGSCSTAASI